MNYDGSEDENGAADGLDLARSVAARLDRPVVLIGLMGAGKTRLGRRLARSLDLPFADSDDEVERAASMTIPEIFATLGEPAFRDGERRVLSRMMGEGVKVIATGGGAVMQPDTAELIWTRAISIWVRADLDTLVSRTRGGRPRPLLEGRDARAVLAELSAVRGPVYARADMAVDTDKGHADAVLLRALQGLARLLDEREKRHG